MTNEVLDATFIASSAPAICSPAPGRLDVFAGKGGALWWNSFQGGKWSGWQSLGGQIASVGTNQVANPAAVSWGPNRIDVFVRGSDNHLQHIHWDGSNWSAWESLGETLTTGPGACSWGAQRLDVFWGGKDKALWHKSWDGGVSWSKAESLGGAVTSDPAAVAFQSLHPGGGLKTPPSFRWMHVFVRSVDQQLWHRPWTWETTADPKKPISGWGAWESRGGILTSGAGSSAAGAGACVWQGNAIYLFVGGPINQPTANALWGTAWKDPSWNPWSEFQVLIANKPGPIQVSADPDAVMSQADHVDVVTRAPNGTIWHTTLAP